MHAIIILQVWRNAIIIRVLGEMPLQFLVSLICAIFYYRRSSGSLSGPYTSRASHGVNSPCRPFAFLSFSPLPICFPLAPNQAPPQPSQEARPPQEPRAPASAGGPAATTASCGSAAGRCAPRRRCGGGRRARPGCTTPA